VADRDLFTGYDGYLNLGGIANISIRHADQNWNAWDICPCNQALNFLAAKKGKEYDADGLLAASGNVLREAVEALKKYFPSTHGHGFSLSNNDVQKTWLKFLESASFDTSDLLASTSAAIAELITDHLSSIRKTPAKILVTGGGAHNPYLLQQLNAPGASYSFTFEKPENIIIDFKESLLMAYLGYLTYHGRPYGIHSITGAKKDSIGGAFYKAYK